MVMMCSFACVIKKERSRYELTLIRFIVSSLIQCHKKKYILLLILLIYFRAHIYSLKLHHSNECFYLMKTPFICTILPRCPWYMRIKRQYPSNIFLTILICFLAQSATQIPLTVRPKRLSYRHALINTSSFYNICRKKFNHIHSNLHNQHASYSTLTF